jgi:hypothetical protein
VGVDLMVAREKKINQRRSSTKGWRGKPVADPLDLLYSYLKKEWVGGKKNK